jgi:hypothetical protein
MPLGCFRSALAGIVRPVDAEVAGEQEDLLFIAAQPGAEGVAGVVPVVPVAQPVVDDPGRDRGVVAFPQACEDLRVQGRAAAGAGFLDRLVRLAQDRDDVASRPAVLLLPSSSSLSSCPAGGAVSPRTLIGADRASG